MLPNIDAAMPLYALVSYIEGGAAVQQVWAQWVSPLPNPAGIKFAVLYQDNASTQQKAGLYTNEGGDWHFVMPYLNVMSFVISGGQLEAFINITTAFPVPAGALVFQDGVASHVSTIPAGVGTWSILLLSNLGEAIKPATATTLGTVIVKDGLTVDASGNLKADVLSVAGRTGAITLAVADVAGAAPSASPTLTSPTFTNTPLVTFDGAQTTYKFQIAKFINSGTGGDTAPTTLDNASVYMQVGGSEWILNSYRMIGFGTVDNDSNDIPPLMIGYQETDGYPGEGTKGDFIVAARADTDMSAPVVTFRMTADGRALITNDQTASGYAVQDQELVTNKHLVASIPSSLGPATSTKLGTVIVKDGLTVDVNGNLKANVLSVAGKTGAIALAVSDISGASPTNAPVFTSRPTVMFTGAETTYKFIVAKHLNSDSAADAPTTLDNKSVYMQLGGSEMGANSYRLIGLGYGWDQTNDIAPVMIGMQETDSTSNTKGNFIVATRNTTGSSDQPTVQFTVTTDGRPLMTNDQTAVGYVLQDQELVTHKHLNKSVPSTYVNIDNTSGTDWTALYPVWFERMICEDLIIPANFAGSTHYMYAAAAFDCILYVFDEPPNTDYSALTAPIGTVKYAVTGGGGGSITSATGSCPEYLIKAGHRLLFTNDPQGSPGNNSYNQFASLVASFPLHRP